MQFIFRVVFLPILLVLPAGFGGIAVSQTGTQTIRTEIANAASILNIRDKGSQPFDLRAEFDAVGKVEFTGHGQYEELWIDDEHWQRKVDLGSYHAVETRNGSRHSLDSSSNYEPKRVMRLLQLLQFQPFAFIKETDQWQVTEPSPASLRYELRRDGSLSSVFLFEKDSHELMQGEGLWSITKYQNYLKFSDHSIPSEIQEFTAAGAMVLTIKVTQLTLLTSKEFAAAESGSPSQESTATLLPREPASEGVTPPKIIKAPDPKYPKVERKAKSVGLALINMVVDQTGAVREAEIANSVEPDFGQAALDAVSKWKMQPAEWRGSPAATIVNVEMNFRIR